jgi:hypothetical protein
MKVSATGMPVARLNARSAGAARARTTPLPASATGRRASRSSAAAACSSAAAGCGSGPAARQRRRRRAGRGQDVLGQLDVGRARLLGLGDLEGLAHDLGDDLRAHHAGVPLRDRAEELDEVDALVGLLVQALEVGLAGQGHERRPVQQGVTDRRDEVHRPRSQRAEAHARAPGEPSDRCRPCRPRPVRVEQERRRSMMPAATR